MTLKEQIETLIELIKSGVYDEEDTHGQYDQVIEQYCLHYDESLLLLITELINLPKNFWYA